MRNHLHVITCGLLFIFLCSQILHSADEKRLDAKTLVLVNGHRITTADLDLKCLVRGISSEDRDSLRQQLLEELINEQLISEFLKSRRIQASPEAVDAQIDALKTLIRRRGHEPEQLLNDLGLSEKDLRVVLLLPAAWQAYVSQVVTDKQLKDKFTSYQRELDGTQLRARHIVIKVPADSSDEVWSAADRTLRELRQRITSGQVSFTEAAREHSEGPSAATGGDVGFFPHRGIMPSLFADAAFSLKKGEISEPIHTSVGVHLIEVTDVQPGQLSLEDVRSAVLDRITQEMWDTQVAQLRVNAQIEGAE